MRASLRRLLRARGVGRLAAAPLRNGRLPPLLLRPHALYGFERAPVQALRHVHGIESRAETFFPIAHDSASFSCFLPREIHEYTVLTGASSIEAISGAEYPSHTDR